MISSFAHSDPDKRLDHASPCPESIAQSNGDETTRKVIPLSEEKKKDNAKNKDESPLVLPEPDSDNITVLTDKLPNRPILPWNRYDSPWQESEETPSESDVNSEETPESSKEEE